jgi:arylsulfatase A-like enzyme
MMIARLALAISILGGFAINSCHAEEQRPNILFISTDDLAYQALSAYGSPINQTPQIDRLAKQGVRFDRCYVTNSLCGPSRACILTGKYSHKNGFRTNKDKFDGSQETYPKLLQKAGYQTAVIGKWHLVSDPTGFDFWQILPGQGRYYSPQFITAQGKMIVPGYVTDVITERALGWLKSERDPSKPFMLMVQHKAPHREWAPSPAHLRDFAGKEVPEPKTLFDDYRNRADAARQATMRVADDLTLESDLKLFEPTSPLGKYLFGLMSPDERQAWVAAYEPENKAFRDNPPTGKDLVHWKYQRYIKDYLRCVRSVDDSVGRILDYLDQTGLAKNTMVVFVSDQGFYLGEHGWFDKRFMYEQSLRTPLLVRWPGIAAAGGQEGRIVSNIDFAETFLDLAGVAPPADMQGRSLVPLLRGQPPDDWRKSFYYQYYEGPPAVHTVAEHYGVTDGRYKLIHFHTLGQWELFDLKSDPEELTSVYGRPEYAEVQARMLKELNRLRGELQVTSDSPG